MGIARFALIVLALVTIMEVAYAQVPDSTLTEPIKPMCSGFGCINR
jgi:hypothetical protein